MAARGLTRRTAAARRRFVERYDGEREVRFFDNYLDWALALETQHPAARVRVECRDARRIHRAFVGRIKVGAFGNLPGHGYIVGTFIGELLHGKGKARDQAMT